MADLPELPIAVHARLVGAVAGCTENTVRPRSSRAQAGATRSPRSARSARSGQGHRPGAMPIWGQFGARPAVRAGGPIWKLQVGWRSRCRTLEFIIVILCGLFLLEVTAQEEHRFGALALTSPFLSGWNPGLFSGLMLAETPPNDTAASVDKKLEPPSAAIVVTDVLALLFLGLSAFFLVRRYRPGPTAESGELSNCPSALGLILGILFIVLSTAHPFVQSRAGRSGYSFVSATVLIYFMKCCISTAMYAGNHGDWAEALRRSKERVPTIARLRIPSCLAPAVPGALLGSYDAMSFMALERVDPITYNVVLRLRVVFIGLLWQFVFGRRVSIQQWTALMLYSIASIARELGQLEQLGTTAVWPFIFLLIQTSIGCVATVVSEKVLKDLGMPTDIVNTWLYFWGLVTLLLFQVFADGGLAALWKDLFGGEAWGNLAHDGYMVASIFMLSIFGVVTAYFLREFSSISKEMCGAVVIILTALVEWLFQFSSVSFQGVLAVVASAVATILFATHPLKAAPTPEPQALDPGDDQPAPEEAFQPFQEEEGARERKAGLGQAGVEPGELELGDVQLQDQKG